MKRLIALLLCLSALLIGCGTASQTDVQPETTIPTEATAPETTVPETTESIATQMTGSSDALVIPVPTEATEPQQVTYIANTNTMKFHYPDCASVPTIHEENKQLAYGTRDDLMAEGFTPCGNCHP